MAQAEPARNELRRSRPLHEHAQRMQERVDSAVDGSRCPTARCQSRSKVTRSPPRRSSRCCWGCNIWPQSASIGHPLFCRLQGRGAGEAPADWRTRTHGPGDSALRPHGGRREAQPRGRAPSARTGRLPLRLFLLESSSLSTSPHRGPAAGAQRAWPGPGRGRQQHLPAPSGHPGLLAPPPRLLPQQRVPHVPARVPGPAAAAAALTEAGPCTEPGAGHAAAVCPLPAAAAPHAATAVTCFICSFLTRSVWMMNRCSDPFPASPTPSVKSLSLQVGFSLGRFCANLTFSRFGGTWRSSSLCAGHRLPASGCRPWGPGLCLP